MSRVGWIDQAKGIGIVLVVMAHSDLDYGWVGSHINAFHMPLFFFLSGFLFSIDKYEGFQAFIRKKSASILVPYFTFALLSMAYFLLRYQFGDPNYFKDLDIGKQLLGVFYSAGIRELMDFNLPLWFLTCLFSVEVMFYAIRRWITSPMLIVAVLLGSSLLGYLDGRLNPVKLPWGVDVALTAVVFYGAGYLLKHSLPRLIARPVLERILLCAGLVLVNALLVSIRVNLNMKVHGNYFVFYLCAFAGLIACILLSSLFRSSFVAFLGKNALIIMALHVLVLNMASKLNDRLGIFYGLYMKELADTGLTILLLIPIIYVINRHMPFILGKRLQAEAPKRGTGIASRLADTIWRQRKPMLHTNSKKEQIQ
jgi:acyltransferase